MKYLALALIFIGGCNELLKPTVPSADIAAEIAVRYAAAMLNAPKPTPAPAPAPVTQCNKCTNGKVKTGDGLDWTQCECGDECKCETKAEPPPLVKVPEKPKTQNDGHVECRNGVCYWVERSTGKRYRIVQ